jgi:uncharacterized protein YacL
MFYWTNIMESGTLPVPIVLTIVNVFISIISILFAFEFAMKAYNPLGCIIMLTGLEYGTVLSRTELHE